MIAEQDLKKLARAKLKDSEALFMREIFKKFFEIEKEIASEKGEFELFGLFQRENSLPNLWDVVVAANWFGSEKVGTINYFSSKFREKLTAEEMVMVSAILLLKPDEPFVQEIAEAIQSQNGSTRMPGLDFNGMAITEGVIIAPKHEAKRGKQQQAA